MIQLGQDGSLRNVHTVQYQPLGFSGGPTAMGLQAMASGLSLGCAFCGGMMENACTPPAAPCGGLYCDGGGCISA